MSYFAKSSKGTDEGSEEDFQEEELSFLHCIMPWLDEEGGRQEGQVGDLEGA